MGGFMGMMMAIPLIILAIIIIPIWLFLHYNNSSNRNGQPQVEQQRIQQLTTEVEQMRKRIEVLETILDEEYPNWRGLQ